MPRTKGSKNKKVVEVKVSSNFKSLEVKETKTEVFEIGISKNDIESLLMRKAKKIALFDEDQQFESQKLTYDKKGNMFITLINPINLPKIKDEKSTDTSDKK